jgi:hypothetical protein
MRSCGHAGAALFGAAALAVSGCASRGPVLEAAVAGRYEARVELEGTPFFPQEQYQCGPAALATVLSASGATATPESLVPEVYLPGRQGSLQPELVAAARRHGRVPYLVPPVADALIAAVAGGLPVLVLQKLGAGPVPGWHYAVLIGYDVPRDRVVLRSGTERRSEMSAARFAATWDRAGRWAMVALQPGVLPPEPDFTRYMEAVAGLEAVGRRDAATPSYEAAARHWPSEALPRLALANLAYARGDLVAAELGFREAAQLDPANAAAHNNRADVLRQLGCVTSARREIQVAQTLAAGGPLAATVEATARSIAAMADGDATGCPVD